MFMLTYYINIMCNDLILGRVSVCDHIHSLSYLSHDYSICQLELQNYHACGGHLAAIFGTYRWSICYFNATVPLFFVNAVPLHGGKHGQWPTHVGACEGLV